MQYRFRKLSDRQVIGLFLLLQMVRNHRDAVRLTSNALRSAIGLAAVHRPRASALAKDMAPFFLAHKTETWVGRPRSLLLKVAEGDNPQHPLLVDSWPNLEDAEKNLGISVEHFQTEWVRQQIIKPPS